MPFPAGVGVPVARVPRCDCAGSTRPREAGVLHEGQVLEQPTQSDRRWLKSGLQAVRVEPPHFHARLPAGAPGSRGASRSRFPPTAARASLSRWSLPQAARYRPFRTICFRNGDLRVKPDARPTARAPLALELVQGLPASPRIGSPTSSASRGVGPTARPSRPRPSASAPYVQRERGSRPRDGRARRPTEPAPPGPGSRTALVQACSSSLSRCRELFRTGGATFHDSMSRDSASGSPPVESSAAILIGRRQRRSVPAESASKRGGFLALPPRGALVWQLLCAVAQIASSCMVSRPAGYFASGRCRRVPLKVDAVLELAHVGRPGCRPSPGTSPGGS